jgi:hypothetical protein
MVMNVQGRVFLVPRLSRYARDIHKQCTGYPQIIVGYAQNIHCSQLEM